MNKIELFKMAFTNLFRRKIRSVLAILGVLIGTSSIITMVSIGLGISKNYSDAIKKNDRIHIIEIYGINSRNTAVGQQSMKMDDKTVKYLKSIKGITHATPVKNISSRIIIGNYVADMNIQGFDPEFFEKANVKVSNGRILKKGDKYKFLFGEFSIYNFQNYRTGRYVDYNPDGQAAFNIVSPKIEITNDQSYKKAKSNSVRYGILQDNDDNPPKYEIFKGESIGIITGRSEYSYSAYTTLETIELIEKSNKRAENAVGKKNYNYYSNTDGQYNSMLIYIEDINIISDVTEKLRKDGFQFYSVMDEVKEVQKMYAMIQGALGGIGAISLFVAAIGITNTMIMSIYERTKEIGVMKVIGANLQDIKRLFLYEAASIGLIGGIIGTILSLIISYILNTLFSNMGADMGMMTYSYGMNYYDEVVKQYISYIPLWLAIFGIAFSTLIGIISGYLPAKKAMSMSALESLRNE